MSSLALVLGTAWLLWVSRETQGSPRSTRASHEPMGTATAAGAEIAFRQEAVEVAPPAPASRGQGDRVLEPDPRPAPAGAPPPPDEGPDAAAWREARVAFRVRELGRMAPYVKSRLDAAHREMAFCFRQPGAAGGRGAEAQPGPDPAVLLLYLQARDGALDVVDTKTEYLGTSAREVVDCCREVLRGLEIPVFDAVPGRRYRVKYRLR